MFGIGVFLQLHCVTVSVTYSVRGAAGASGAYARLKLSVPKPDPGSIGLVACRKPVSFLLELLHSEDEIVLMSGCMLNGCVD